MTRVAVCLLAWLGGCATTHPEVRPVERAPTALTVDPPTPNERVQTFDLTGHSRPDVWRYTVPTTDATGATVDRVVRQAFDLNADGKVDLTRWYDEQGRVVKEALDLDFDGALDQVNHFVNGVITEKQRALSHDGKPSLWQFYERGQLIRKERDTLGTGKVDTWEYWEGEHLLRTGEDIDGDGLPDRWTKRPDTDG